MERQGWDIHKVLAVLARRMVWILVIALFGGLVAFAYTEVLVEPTYKATVSLYVRNSMQRGDSITYSELTTSARLVEPYIIVMRSDTVLENLAKKMDLKYTPAQLRRMITIAAVNETEALTVEVVSPRAEEAADIANTLIKVAPIAINRIISAGTLEIIDYAQTPKAPFAPNTRQSVLMGIMIGLILSCAAFLMAAFFDTTIRSEEDLTQVFDIPILGCVPKIAVEQGGGK